MNTASQSTGRGNKEVKVAIIALSVLLLWSFGATAIFQSRADRATAALNEGKLANELLLAEKLQLEKRLIDLNVRLQHEQEDLATSEHSVRDLQRKVDAAIARSKGLEGAARKSKNLANEVAELRTLEQRMQARLQEAINNEQDLQSQLAKMTQERDDLAAEFEDHKASAQMVNNAEVDALRGKKGRLTVVARRAKEIRMAFDLPQSMAPDASFKIIAPDGRNYAGADPAISMSMDEVENEPIASIDMMPDTPLGDRAARVHLKFAPKEKLIPGTYRIDVMAGGGYLNTVLLNLR